VQNSVDTSELVELRYSISASEIDNARRSLNIASSNAGVYVGALYREKRLRFLIEALPQIKRLVPDFQAIIVGGGKDAALVSDAAREHSWIHYLGPLFGRDKVTVLKLAKVMLMPGRVGLAAVDAFAMETPIVTVDGPYHAPEIAYLNSGNNAIILPKDATPTRFAEAVARLLQSQSSLERLKEGCRDAAKRYTLPEMVKRFSDGIAMALNERALP
jgi:glycosyltransferase involved in cell wall biosynthesis